MMRALAAIALVTSAARSDAAPTVHGDLSEARACLPVTGGALVGTAGGLAFVDERGDVRRVWTASSGLPGTRIERIVRVGDRLWIGTDAGAARVTFDGALTVAQVVHARGVRDVLRHGDRTYVATWGEGVRVLGGGAVRYRIASIPTQRLNVAALAVHDGALHAATGAGLYRLQRGALEATVDELLPKGTPVAALLADGSRLYMGTAAGLYVREGRTTRLVGAGDIRHVGRADDGSIVVARLGEGMARVDRGRLVTLHDLPRDLATAQTFAFAPGGACAGGIDGAYLRGRGAWTRMVRPAGPPSNDISAIAVDGARLWVGTFDRGLVVRERGAWRTVRVDVRINALHVARDRVWVATASGLYSVVPRADGRDEIARLARADGLPGRGVLSLAGLRDGRVLVGTSAGAVIVGAGRPIRLAKGQDLGNVWAVAEDAAGALWLGTTTGLYRGSESATTWQRFAVATKHLRDDWVTALAVSRDALFVGTYHGGVTRLELASTAATQLGDGWINPGGLALDGDRLLAATMDGLRSGDGTTASWTTHAGLPGKDVTMVARAGKTLFVATRRGLVELR